MNKAIYPGSFDPFTNGHLEVLKKASQLFDEVIVLMSINPKKQRKIDDFKMKKAIEDTMKKEGISNVRVEISEELTARVALLENAFYLVRGLRNGTDYEYEENIAQINTYINPNIETIYFRAGKNSHISSSAVMELLRFNHDVHDLVPESVYELLKNCEHSNGYRKSQKQYKDL